MENEINNLHNKETVLSDKIKTLDEKIKQLQQQKQAIINREKEKERKERTRRLIQNGALAEQYLCCEKMDPKDFELFLKRVVALPQVADLLSVLKDSPAKL